MNCGLCGHTTSLLCASCVNQAMLKYRIQQIETEHTGRRYSRQIDSILERCINHHSYGYICGQVVRGGGRDGGRDGGHDGGSDAAAERDAMTTTLAQQLLHIEIVQLKKAVLQQKDRVDRLAVRNEQQRARIAEWRARNARDKRAVAERKAAVAREAEAGRARVQDCLRRGTAANRAVAARLAGVQAQCVQELVEAFNVERRDSGTTHVAFAPLVPLHRLVQYDAAAANTVLLRTAAFALHYADCTLVQLPFPVVFPRAGAVARINARQQFFTYAECQPVVLHRNECYPLYMPRDLCGLDKYELNLVVKAMAALVLNLVALVRARRPCALSVDAMVDVGGLVWQLVSSDAAESRKEAFLRIFWGLQKYRAHTAKVDVGMVFAASTDVHVTAPSKAVNDRLDSLDYFTVQLYRLVAGDVRQYRAEHRDQFKTAAGHGENWEVV